MSSKRGGRKGSFAAAFGSGSTKGKSTGHQHGHSSGGFGSGNNSLKIDKLNHVANPGADSAQDTEWEVSGKKSRSYGGNGGAKPQGASSACDKAWGHEEMPQKPGFVGPRNTPGNNWQAQRQVGRGNAKPQPSNIGWKATYMAPPPAIPPPPPKLEKQWAAIVGSSNPSQSKISEDNQTKDGVILKPFDEETPIDEDSGSDMGLLHPDNYSDDDELIVDSDEEFLNDDYDSDRTQKSHESRKKSRWFNSFFRDLEHLTIEQMNEPSRQWHCPACRGGPGAIDWYRGLQPLMNHARTKGSKRALLHREFADLLEEELRRRGTSVTPAGEVHGRWKGLREMTSDYEIVWPPTVVVMNTLLQRDVNDKWIGMGNQELLDYFSSYDARKARHSYGPQGHRGMSVLIFEHSAIGYLEAERLHKHFADEGADKEAWERRRVLFYPGGQRQLYGYLACKKDMDEFDLHHQGRSKLKFEMRSYQEMVVGPMKQMSEDNQLLLLYKNKVAIHQQHEKALQQTMGVMSQQLRITSEENRIVRERTTTQHQENKEQMDYMEHFYNNQLATIQESTDAKELLQEEHEKLSNTSGGKEDKLRREEITRFTGGKMKGIEGLEVKRAKLVQAYEDKKAELERKYLADKAELEKMFNDELAKLKDEEDSPSEPSASS